jgi:hypothetical protein
MEKRWTKVLSTSMTTVSRRASLLMLGGGLIGAVASPTSAKAAPSGKKARRKSQKTCAVQLQALEERLRAECESRPYEPECENRPCERCEPCGDLSREECDALTKKALEKQQAKLLQELESSCRGAVEEICENEPATEACVERVVRCCDPYLDGDAAEAARCLLLAFSSF